MMRCRVFATLMLLTFPAWSGDGRGLAETHCARCHGLDGLATEAGTPHLNAQLETYLGDAMDKLAKGKLPTAIALHVPATLSATDIADIAGHYARAQAVRPAQAAIDPEKVALGEKVYQNRCFDCHADAGREADKGSPLMAGQNLEYLQAQIRLFVNGQRKFGFLQDDAFKGLSLEELDSVAHYFAAQPQIAPPSKGKKRRR